MCCPSDVFNRGYAIIIFAVFVVVAVFLGIRLGVGGGNVAVAVFSIDARGNAVVPGPGDSNGFVMGKLRVDRNQKLFRWKFIYDRLDGNIIWMRISGPIGTSTTETGPVVFWLCGGDASQTCDLGTANRIAGEITEDSHAHISPRGAITQIASDGAAFYYLEVGTTAFPNGAVRQQLCCTTGPGAW